MLLVSVNKKEMNTESTSSTVIEIENRMYNVCIKY